jgi:DNA-binding NarL/FixJ family response regulator
MKKNYPWNVLLVSRQGFFRGALAKVIGLDSRFRLVGELEEAARGREMCGDFAIDLLIVELDWRRAEDFELVREAARRSNIRVLAVLEEGDAFTMARVAEAPIHGCISKDESMEVFEEALVEIASGGTYFPAAFREQAQKLKTDPNAFSKILTFREQEVLWHVAAGLTSRTIATRLNIGLRSVETYRYRMMKKLEIKSAAGLVEYAFRNGLVKK